MRKSVKTRPLHTEYRLQMLYRKETVTVCIKIGRSTPSGRIKEKKKTRHYKTNRLPQLRIYKNSFVRPYVVAQLIATHLIARTYLFLQPYTSS